MNDLFESTILFYFPVALSQWLSTNGNFISSSLNLYAP